MREPRYVTFDGQTYRLRTARELSPREVRQMGPARIARAREIEARARAGTATDGDAREIAELLRQSVRIVLIAPAEVCDRMTDGQRLAVWLEFMRENHG